MSRNTRQSLIWVLKANIAFLLLDLLLLVCLSLAVQADMLALAKEGYFSTTLLLEAAIVFLVGGSIATFSSIFASKIREHVFHSHEDWSMDKQHKSEKKANLFIFLGALLFLESVISSMLIS